jgi:hypothetical protein
MTIALFVLGSVASFLLGARYGWQAASLYADEIINKLFTKQEILAAVARITKGGERNAFRRDE